MKYMVKIDKYIYKYKLLFIIFIKMDIIQYNPNDNFFDQLPYDIVCHIFKFIEKDYNKKILEINYDKFNYIINEDKYISNCRYYKPKPITRNGDPLPRFFHISLPSFDLDQIQPTGTSNFSKIDILHLL
jgi:hypothetical protein